MASAAKAVILRGLKTTSGAFLSNECRWLKRDSEISKEDVLRAHYKEHRLEQLKSFDTLYPYSFPERNASAAEFISCFGRLSEGKEETQETIGLTGRVQTIRSASKKLHFMDIRDGDSVVQVCSYCSEL